VPWIVMIYFCSCIFLSFDCCALLTQYRISFFLFIIVQFEITLISWTNLIYLACLWIKLTIGKRKACLTVQILTGSIVFFDNLNVEMKATKNHFFHEASIALKWFPELKSFEKIFLLNLLCVYVCVSVCVCVCVYLSQDAHWVPIKYMEKEGCGIVCQITLLAFSTNQIHF